jgi:hypothetical protein
MVSVSYSLKGMVEGVLEETQDSLTCGILCNSWPSWAFAARCRSWTIRVIIVKDNKWIPFIYKFFPEVSCLLSTDCEKSIGLGLDVQIWLSKIDPPRRLGLFISDKPKVIVTCRRVRIALPGDWNWHVINVNHGECGGATDGCWSMHVYRRHDTAQLGSIPSLAARDVLSLLDPKVHGISCQAPMALDKKKCQVVRITEGLYHSGGLYPLHAQQPRFVAPCFFSPTGWVRRRLTGKKMCLLKDVPEDVYKEMTSEHVSVVCQDEGLVPVRVILRVLDIIMNDGYKPDHGDAVTPTTSDVPTVQSNILEASEDRNKAAVKADDASVPKYLWDASLVPDLNLGGRKALVQLRALALRWWKCHVRKDFVSWFFQKHRTLQRFRREVWTFDTWNSKFRAHLQSNPEARKDWAAGGDCVGRCCNASWWEWSDGSRPHFWRWCPEYRSQARDGVTPWVRRELPRWLVPQRVERDPQKRIAMRKKLEKVRKL